MIKKLFSVLVLVMALCLLLFACTVNEENKPASESNEHIAAVTPDQQNNPDNSTAHVHAWSEGVITKEATCTETGVKTYTCSGCGESKTEELSPLGHDYKETITAPTCTEEGFTTNACSRCGDSYVDRRTDAKGHSWNGGVVTKEATAESVGEKTFTCTTCGATKTESIPAVGHNYNAVVTAPTCTADGYTTHTCSDCGNSYVDSIIPALGHSWNDGVVTANPTCTEAGVKTFTCSRCKETKRESISAKGHTEVVDQAVAATCTKNGLTKGSHCSVCNTVLVAQTSVPALGHSWDAGIITANPTCTVRGVKTYTCLRCSATNSEDIAATGHTPGEWVTDQEPTCTEQGSKHQVCAECGETINSGAISAIGHIPGEWIIDQEPTCTETGSRHYICSRCHETVTGTIPMKEHLYKGTTCVYCGNKRVVYNFKWEESYEQKYGSYRLITIAVGEEYQLKYSADVTEGLFYDLTDYVFYEPYVVDAPSVISIDENGKIKGLKTGVVGIKNTGWIISGSNNPDDRRIYIQVISEYTETEYNDTLQMANTIKPGQKIKFHLSNTSDVDTFMFTAPSNNIKVICTYHGDYEGAASGQSRLLYVQILNANGTLWNSGTNTHDSAGDVFERTSYIDTSTGYLIFKFNAGYSGLFPSGYFTIEIVAC
ncbi:MAG: hypothetical protein J5584_05560 [Clostridia bacterium]|nr:hypothetical protein [Clostridia bacterium]